MKKVRIGNDVAISWAVFADENPLDLEGRDINLYMVNAFGKAPVSDFEVKSNVISWVFKGKSQKVLGEYSFLLVINEGKDEMISADVYQVLALVSHSCSAGGNPDSNIETSTVDAVSSVSIGFGGGVSLEDVEKMLAPIKESYSRLRSDFSTHKNSDITTSEILITYKLFTPDSFEYHVEKYKLRENAGTPLGALFFDGYGRPHLGSSIFSESEDGKFQRIDVMYLTLAKPIDFSKDSEMYNPEVHCGVQSYAILYDTVNRIVTPLSYGMIDIADCVSQVALLKSEIQALKGQIKYLTDKS